MPYHQDGGNYIDDFRSFYQRDTTTGLLVVIVLLLLIAPTVMAWLGWTLTKKVEARVTSDAMTAVRMSHARERAMRA